MSTLPAALSLDVAADLGSLRPTIPESLHPDLVLEPEQPQDRLLVDALIEGAFGPGRLAKTAERLREGNRPLLDLSRVAWRDGRAVGCVRMWPIRIGGSTAILLGPFAVDETWRSQGLGSQLVHGACEAARQAGHGLVLLVGDAPYFTRLGFEPTPQGRVVLPGPVNPRRLLWRALRPGALDGIEGAVTVG
jgi:predicted N-acetyltransferase YhbS